MCTLLAVLAVSTQMIDIIIQRSVLSCPNKEIQMSSRSSSTSSSYGMMMMRMARIMLTILKKNDCPDDVEIDASQQFLSAQVSDSASSPPLRVEC